MLCLSISSIAICCFLCFVRSQEADDSSSASSANTLRQLHIVFRHGDRSPIGKYPTSPNNDYVWPFGRGELTDVGKRQQYELGTFLRNRYQNFLTSDPREVTVRSSDKPRCLASVQCNLAALYKPTGKWVWDEDFDWQPVPVHTAPGKTDSLLNEDAHCPEAEAIDHQVKNGPVNRAYNEKYKDLFSYLTTHSGEPVNDPTSVLKIYGIVYIEKIKGLTVPEWAAEPIWSQMESAANDAFKVRYSSKKVQRLRGGPLLKEMVDLMQKNASGNFPNLPKAYVYSTHDAILGAVMTATGVFNEVTVPYAATLLVEMHRIQDKDVVRMFYRNSTDVPLHILTVPGCQTDCPLTEFAQKMQDFLPSDWKAECGLYAEACIASTPSP